MDVDKLKRKNNILMTILLVLILFILVVIVCIVRVYLSGSYKCVCEDCDDIVEEINTKSLDNDNYIGIYNYEENNLEETLVLNSDYSALFYIGNNEYKSYYYGKYKIEDKRIVLYDIILNDSSSLEEMYIDDEAIYFNVVSDNEITSLYGRDDSIHLKKIYNVL